MVHRGLEACERLSPLCLYVLGRIVATLQNLYKHVSVHDVAKSIQTRVCTTHTSSSFIPSISALRDLLVRFALEEDFSRSILLTVVLKSPITIRFSSHEFRNLTTSIA